MYCIWSLDSVFIFIIDVVILKVRKMIIRLVILVLKSLESLIIYFGGKWSCFLKKII